MPISMEKFKVFVDPAWGNMTLLVDIGLYGESMQTLEIPANMMLTILDTRQPTDSELYRVWFKLTSRPDMVPMDCPLYFTKDQLDYLYTAAFDLRKKYSQITWNTVDTLLSLSEQ